MPLTRDFENDILQMKFYDSTDIWTRTLPFTPTSIAELSEYVEVCGKNLLIYVRPKSHSETIHYNKITLSKLIYGYIII